MEEKKKFRIMVEYADGSIGFYDFWHEKNVIKAFEDYHPSIERRSCLMIMKDNGLYVIERTVTA